MAYYECTIKIEEPFRDTLVRKLIDAGCLGTIEQDDGVIAYFPETLDINAIANDIALFRILLEKSGHPCDISFSHKLIPHEDWNESWKKGFQPLDIGERFTILPPWEEQKQGRINLIIDPAMAFGTGHHETTRSCLVLMEKYADKAISHEATERTENVKPSGFKNFAYSAPPRETTPCFSDLDQKSFLDLGTGTGILAIAASKLGYDRVLAIDTDILAVEATRKNLEVNRVANVEVRDGSLMDSQETYDVIAANLISGVLVQLAPLFPARMKQGGVAFLSGILSGQQDEVIEAMKAAGLEVIEKYPDGKWVSLVVKKQ